MKTLYICYFGLREPLVQTQVLPYLRLLAEAGIEVTLLTFEPRKWSSKEEECQRSELVDERIQWISRRYHKRPSLPATMYDIAAAALLVSRLVRRDGIDVLHARSHVPAAIALLAKKMTVGRMLFDIRGFFPEEYVDAGVWPAGGFLYKLAKSAEKVLLAGTDGCVVLTNRARDLLRSSDYPTLPARVPVEIIPCCVDTNRFERASVSRNWVRRELNVESRRVVAYVGAMGGWYLSEQMADFVASARSSNPAIFFLVLTQSSAAEAAQLLIRRGIPEDAFLVRTVDSREVANYLSAADFAISFIKPTYSKISSSPTKIGEYLAAGLPVICNCGIGDIDEMLSTETVGVRVRDFTPEAYSQALDQVERLLQQQDIAVRCRLSARKWFDLHAVGGAGYLAAYRRLGYVQEHVTAESSASTSPTAMGA